MSLEEMKFPFQPPDQTVFPCELGVEFGPAQQFWVQVSRSRVPWEDSRKPRLQLELVSSAL
jgi:hypothetical protein